MARRPSYGFGTALTRSETRKRRRKPPAPKRRPTKRRTPTVLSTAERRKASKSTQRQSRRTTRETRRVTRPYGSFAKRPKATARSRRTTAPPRRPPAPKAYEAPLGVTDQAGLARSSAQTRTSLSEDARRLGIEEDSPLEVAAQLASLGGVGSAGRQLVTRSARALAGRSTTQAPRRATPRKPSARQRREARTREALAAERRQATIPQRIAARREAAKVTRGTKRGAPRRIRKRGRRRAYGQAASVSPFIPAAAIGAAEQAGVHNLARAPVETGKALGDPETRKETFEGLKALPVGIATAPYYLARYPKRTVQGMAEHYSDVYGPLLRGDTEGFREALKQPGSGGALTPLIDATLIGGPAASFAAGRAARAGALGPRAQRLMQAERPDLRIGQGQGGVRAQDASGRLGKRFIQARRDIRRREAHERRFGGRDPDFPTRRLLDAIEPSALRAGGPVSARQTVGAGEVVSRGGVGIPGTSRVIPVGGPIVRRREAKATATVQGRGMLQHQNARQALLRETILPTITPRIRKRVERLNSGQQSLVVPAFRGLRILDDAKNVSPRVALQAAERRIAEIRSKQKRGSEKDRRDVPGDAENIADFEDIARLAREDIARLDRGQPAKVFTPELKGAIDELRKAEVRGATRLERAPDLGKGRGELSQGQMARLKPTVEEMVRRGEGGLPPVENVLSTLRLSRYLPDEVSALVYRAQRAKKGTPAYQNAIDALFASEGFGTYLNALGGRRLYTAIEQTGRLRPAHVISQPKTRTKPSLAATGGSRAPAAHRRATGNLRRRGREDMRLETFWQTLERQTKREHTINLVREVADQFGIPMNQRLIESLGGQVDDAIRAMNPEQRATYRGLSPIAAIQELRANGRISVPESLAKRLDDGMKQARRGVQHPRMAETRKVSELLDDLDWLGIDRREVALLNVRGLNRELGVTGNSIDDFGRATAQVADPIDPAFASAFRNNARNAAEAANAQLLDEAGYIAIPQRVMDELFQAPNKLTKAARIFDINKGQFSRLLLGYGNLSWAGFQIAANAFLTGVTGTGPITAIQAQLWWRRLSDVDRKALMPILNQHRHLMDVRKPHLGATGGPIADQFRALRNTGLYQKLRRASPAQVADLMFGADMRQTAFFRRSVLYNRARREAFERMNANVGAAARIQNGLGGRLFDPRRVDAAINDVIRNRRSLERHAQHVDRMLGDYLSYTAAERATLQRFTMFYGFVRHSVQYALWTMPTRHPVTLGILSKLALFYDKEQRELLGLDYIPFALAGMRFSLDDPNGLVLSANRFAPFGNALFEAQHPSQLVGILPPALSVPASRLTGINLFTGRPFTTGGESAGQAAFRTATEGGGQVSTWDALLNLRMYANEMEQMTPPIRYARKVIQRGPHGDDSSLTLGARPIESESAQAAQREEQGRHPLDIIATQLSGTRRVSPGQLGFYRDLERGGTRSSGGGSRAGSSGSGGVSAPWRRGSSGSSSGGVSAPWRR